VKGLILNHVMKLAMLVVIVMTLVGCSTPDTSSSTRLNQTPWRDKDGLTHDQAPASWRKKAPASKQSKDFFRPAQ
jgi:hypothetical protein